MNKGELIEEVAGKTGIPKRKIGIVLDSAFDVIKDEVAAGKRVTINTFGSFFLKHIKGKTIKSTVGGAYDMPAHEVPKFKAAPEFKDRI